MIRIVILKRLTYDGGTKLCVLLLPNELGEADGVAVAPVDSALEVGCWPLYPR